MEYTLIKALGNKSLYDSIRGFIPVKSLTKETQSYLNSIDGYYESHPETDNIPWTEWASYYKLVYSPVSKEDEVIRVDALSDRLSCEEPYKDGASSLVNRLLHQAACESIAKIAYDAAVNPKDKGDIHKVSDVLLDLDVRTGAVSAEVMSDPSKIIREGGSTATGEQYNWKLEELRRSLGPVSCGDLVIIAGRPEIGKTSFALDQLAWFVENSSETGNFLIFNNEEKTEAISERFVHVALGVTHHDVTHNPVKVSKDYDEWLGERHVGIVSDPLMNTRKVEGLCRKYQPRVIVFNVLDKVRGFEGDRDDLRLRNLFQWARSLSYDYGPVLGLMQADATAEGEKYPGMHQIYGSKTAVQGEADAVVMIGADATDPNHRYLNIPKNKLPEGSDTSLRHAKFIVGFEGQSGRYRSLIV